MAITPARRQRLGPLPDVSSESAPYDVISSTYAAHPCARPPRPTPIRTRRRAFAAPIACPFGDSLVLALPDVYDTAVDDEFRFWAEFSFDTPITEATLDFTWRDQGFGNQKGKIMVEQSDHSGNLVASTTLDGFSRAAALFG